MDHRYNARHISRGRHAVDAANGDQKRMRFRPKRKRRLLPAAAALTIAGALFGGVAAAVHFSSTPTTNAAYQYNPADFAPPADREAHSARGSRDDRAAVAGSEGAGSGSKDACEASFYDQPQVTASGEHFNPDALTVAHPDLPFNTNVKVTNVASGESVVVRVNDRGPYAEGRCLDLSRAAFARIGDVTVGVVDVRFEVVKD